MNKPVIWINIIFLILLLIGLIWVLTGCATTKQEQWRDGSRVLAHQERQNK